MGFHGARKPLPGDQELKKAFSLGVCCLSACPSSLCSLPLWESEAPLPPPPQASDIALKAALLKLPHARGLPRELVVARDSFYQIYALHRPAHLTSV